MHAVSLVKIKSIVSRLFEGKLMFHVEHQFNLLKVQLINKYEFKNQITMLIILLKTTLMKNINHIINISIIKTVDIYVSRET